MKKILFISFITILVLIPFILQSKMFENTQPEFCPDEYRWSVSHSPSYEWASPKLFRSWNNVHFVNYGEIDVYNVTATISCTPKNVTVIDNQVTLGDIPVGHGAWSKDDFTLEVDMTNEQADPNKGICWIVEYDDASGDHHIVEGVAIFCDQDCSNLCP